MNCIGALIGMDNCCNLPRTEVVIVYTEFANNIGHRLFSTMEKAEAFVDFLTKFMKQRNLPCNCKIASRFIDETKEETSARKPKDWSY